VRGAALSNLVRKGNERVTGSFLKIEERWAARPTPRGGPVRGAGTPQRANRVIRSVIGARDPSAFAERSPFLGPDEKRAGRG
jgi:hypothetical protein